MAQETFSGTTVLVVDDDAMMRRGIVAQLVAAGAGAEQAESLATARRRLAEREVDVVFLDVNLPDGLGPDLLREKVFSPNTAVVVMTAQGGIAGAVEAMRLGAVDYLTKPFDLAELALVLENARRARQSARVAEYRRGDKGSLIFGTALAELERIMQRILVADRRLGTQLPPVLIEGETGTGKTAIARWLHEQGPRGGRELVEVNCSALPEALAESELFGHERGAFTDARAGRIGLFEAADGGTLFLDELASLSLPLQAKVLKAIEDRRIRRVGGNQNIPVDARVIGATNRDLKTLVTQGLFREDLLHRLDLYRVRIPPLRERGTDILRLAESFVKRVCQRHGLPLRKITLAGQQRLLVHPWPGNVRELAHEVERAVVFADEPELDFAPLRAGGEVAAAGSGAGDWLNEGFTFDGFSLEEAIDRLVDLALKRVDGNVSAAARLLNVKRDFVRYRLMQRGQQAGGEAGAEAED